MESYYRCSDLSDIEVAYLVSGETSAATRAAKRRKQEPTARYPAHKLCLSSNSSVFKNEIEAGAAVVQVVLESEEDIAAADAMIAVMYGVPDALAGLSQQTLCRTALLANKYDAPKVLSTAAQELSAQPAEAATLDLFWDLPGLWEQPFWPLLQQAIDHKLASTDSNRTEAVMNLLLYVCDRDLEAVWSDSSSFRRELLMQLPVAVLTAFLQSSELRVVSEDTVLFTVAKRAEWQEQRSPAVPAAQIKQECEQVMGAVRMPQLTPSALALIAPRLQWISQEQCTLALFAKQRKLSRALHADLRVPAVWLLGERQQSPKASHTMEFACDLSAIQSCCSRALAAAVGRNRNLHVACSSSFGGRDWQFQWQATRVEAGVDLSVFLGPCFANLPSTKFSSNIASACWSKVPCWSRVGALLNGS